MSKFWLHKITLQFTICNEDLNSKLQDVSQGSASLYLTRPFTFHLTLSKFKFQKKGREISWKCDTNFTHCIASNIETSSKQRTQWRILNWLVIAKISMLGEKLAVDTICCRCQVNLNWGLHHDIFPWHFIHVNLLIPIVIL